MNPKMLRTDATDGRKCPVEDVVEAPKLPRALDGPEILGLLDDTENRPIPRVVGAGPAGIDIGQVEALRALAHPLRHGLECRREPEDVGGGPAQEMEGEALSRALADARKAAQLVNQRLNGPWIAHAAGSVPGRARIVGACGIHSGDAAVEPPENGLNEARAAGSTLAPAGSEIGPLELA